MTVTLESPRLILRVPTEADLDGWAGFEADARATRFFGGPKNRGQAWEMLASNAGMWSLRGYRLFSVFERASRQWVGRVGPWKPEGATAEIGWAILASPWGRGCATEDAAATINWVIDHLHWTEIAHCIDTVSAPNGCASPVTPMARKHRSMGRPQSSTGPSDNLDRSAASLAFHIFAATILASARWRFRPPCLLEARGSAEDEVICLSQDSTRNRSMIRRSDHPVRSIFSRFSIS
jgi:RimJ/RimL family protein N-acetyltransferase